jgi:predicted SnoaL-like aldol condensation-catalyzing enzyme
MCSSPWTPNRSIATFHRTTSSTVPWRLPAARAKAFLKVVRAASPHSSQRLLRAFVDGDHVIIHYHVKKSPEDLGFVVMDIFRLTDGLVVEHWDCVQDVPAHSPNTNSMF